MTNLEGLILVLGKETAGYIELAELADKKRRIIIDKDLAGLESSSAKEQSISDELKSLEKQRIDLLKSFTESKDQVPTVSQVIAALPDGSEERTALQKAKDDVVRVAGQMQFLNTQNEVLLKQAMEMVEFDLTLFKSLRQAPESGNYGRDAYTTGDLLPSGGFDAKQ